MAYESQLRVSKKFTTHQNQDTPRVLKSWALTLYSMITINNFICLMINIIKRKAQHLLVLNHAPPNIRKTLHNKRLSPSYFFVCTGIHYTHYIYRLCQSLNQVKSSLYTCIFQMCYLKIAYDCLIGLDKRLCQVKITVSQSSPLVSTTRRATKYFYYIFQVLTI
jgi:hypothetical protein